MKMGSAGENAQPQYSLEWDPEKARANLMAAPNPVTGPRFSPGMQEIGKSRLLSEAGRTAG